jgi:hypothetical protein
VNRVLVMMPGFLGGAGDFDYMARRIIQRTNGTTAASCGIDSLRGGASCRGPGAAGHNRRDVGINSYPMPAATRLPTGTETPCRPACPYTVIESAKAPEAPSGQTVLQQIAMEVADLDALKRIRAYLLEHKAPKVGPIKHEGAGNDYTFDFDDPEGNRLQFFCEMDQIGWDGKSRPKEQWKRFTVED